MIRRILPPCIFLGDSLITQGGYVAATLADPERVQDYTFTNNAGTMVMGAGYNNGAGVRTLYAGGNFTDQTGTIGAFFKRLRERGIRINQTNWHAGKSGSVIFDGADGGKSLYQEHLAAGARPHCIVIQYGTNNAFASPYSANSITLQLNQLFSAIGDIGNYNIVMRDIPSVANDSAFTGEPYDSNVTAINSELEAYATAKAWKWVSIYDAMGGATPNSSLFKTDDFHPNEAGSTLIGRAMADAF